jgi:hypothetical protein
MSNGELRIDGAVATYELKMPTYEIAHLKSPGDVLFDNIQFAGGKLLEKHCSSTPETLTCTGKYLFNQPVDELAATCRFASVTAPNHVHIFRATKATGQSDQAFFDLSFTETLMKFRPPTAGEFFLKALVEGFRRGLSGLTTALFLFAIAMVAKDRKQFLTLAAILMIVEVATAAALPLQLSPKFLEAAAALSTAYVAMEKLLLPDAGQRWLVIGVLGIFHGLFFRFFAVELSGAPSLAGFGAGLVIANLFWMAPASLLRLLPERGQRIFTAFLFLCGTFWFLYRILR